MIFYRLALAVTVVELLALQTVPVFAEALPKCPAGTCQGMFKICDGIRKGAQGQFPCESLLAGCNSHGQWLGRDNRCRV